MRFFLRAAMAELSAVWRGKRALAMLIALPVCVCLVSVIVPDDVMEPAVPVGWAANFLISYIEYRRGKWKLDKPRKAKA